MPKPHHQLLSAHRLGGIAASLGCRLVATLSLFALVLTAPVAEAADRLRVCKNQYPMDGNIYVRTTLDAAFDTVVRIRTGDEGPSNNQQINYHYALVAPTSEGAADDIYGAVTVHPCGDDTTPWFLNGTYIGANHGCSDARIITSSSHGLTTADLGSGWIDGAGTTFYIMKIPDANSLWVLSENTGTGDIWRFNGTIVGSSLTRIGSSATLAVDAYDMVQLRPALRITRQDYLLDGNAWDFQPAEGQVFEIVEDYDIINTGAVLADVIAHPGEQRDFVAPSLPAVVSNHIVYRFLPNSANVIHHTAQAQQNFDISGYGYMGFIQTTTMTMQTPTGMPACTIHDLYIPKTLPFSKNGVSMDFRGRQDYILMGAEHALPLPVTFSAANNNIDNPANLPDRFIHLRGHQESGNTVYDLGFALGYSQVQGMTVPGQRAANTNEAVVLASSAKIYPRALDAKMNGGLIAVGTTFDCTAYRQYFSPAAHPNATCCYWHPEGAETVLYLDYHKSVDHDVILLPATFTGKTVRVVEKTASLTVNSGSTVPETGLQISVTGGYGSLVLAIAEPGTGGGGGNSGGGRSGLRKACGNGSAAAAMGMLLALAFALRNPRQTGFTGRIHRPRPRNSSSSLTS